MFFGPTWPERLLRSGFALCLGGSCVILAGLLQGMYAPIWSRAALLLQAVALLLGVGLILLRCRSPRWLLYPVVLAWVVYLWDTTLPPPNLPDGLIRGLLPWLALAGIMLDALMVMQRQFLRIRVARTMVTMQRPGRRAIAVHNGLVPVETIAELLQISPEELVARLQRHGRYTIDTPDHGSSCRLTDLMLVLRYWHTDGERLSPADNDERS